MEETLKDWQRPPRSLTYRSHYRWYAGILTIAWLACVSAAAWILYSFGWHEEWVQETSALLSMGLLLPVLYLVWIHPKLTRTVQVFYDHIRISTPRLVFDIQFNDIEKISRPFLSFMRLKTKDGGVWWFSASMERPDYLWEGIRQSRPELTGSLKEYEDFRLRLVQYDHHEKRKEWFFKHRFLDVLNWVALPAIVLLCGYKWQVSEVVIHSKALYFFRLAMFTFLAMTVCAFTFSMALKRFIFDHAVKAKMEGEDKRRDLAWESSILQKSKWVQLSLCTLLMGFVLDGNYNLYSITRLREGAQAFHLNPGTSAIVDNRFNCVACNHSLVEGDMVLFGKGTLGRVLALPGEVIAQAHESGVGRTIASDTVTEVPAGFVALQAGPEGREVALVKISDLIGKLKKP